MIIYVLTDGSKIGGYPYRDGKYYVANADDTLTDVEAELPKNATSYAYYAVYNPQNADDTVNPQNYAYTTSESASFVINPITVRVTLQFNKKEYVEGSDNQLKFDVEVTEEFSQFANTFTTKNAAVLYRKVYDFASNTTTNQLITNTNRLNAGNYQFTISSTKENYTLIGDITGTYSLGVKTISTVIEDDGFGEITLSATALSDDGFFSFMFGFANARVLKSGDARYSEFLSYVETLGNFFAPTTIGMVIDATTQMQVDGGVQVAFTYNSSLGSDFQLYLVTKDGDLKAVNYKISDGMVIANTSYAVYFVVVVDAPFP